MATCPTCSVYHGAVPTFYERDECSKWTTSRAPKMKGARDSFLRTASMRNGQHLLLQQCVFFLKQDIKWITITDKITLTRKKKSEKHKKKMTTNIIKKIAKYFHMFMIKYMFIFTHLSEVLKKINKYLSNFFKLNISLTL